MTEADLSRTCGSGGFLGPIDGTLGDLINKLQATYCRSLGVEFQNISDKAQREWLAQQMEPVLNRPEPVQGTGPGGAVSTDRGRGVRAVPAAAVPGHEGRSASRGPNRWSRC
jgi:hypothetical protein